MLTTRDDPREVQACHKLGCSHYIVKPVEYDKFFEVLGQLALFLRRRQAIRQPPRQERSLLESRRDDVSRTRSGYGDRAEIPQVYPAALAARQ
jgi:response regulator of citrate/malate metabolism